MIAKAAMPIDFNQPVSPKCPICQERRITVAIYRRQPPEVLPHDFK
jgi:hypothetical protein